MKSLFKYLHTAFLINVTSIILALTIYFIFNSFSFYVNLCNDTVGICLGVNNWLMTQVIVGGIIISLFISLLVLLYGIIQLFIYKIKYSQPNLALFNQGLISLCLSIIIYFTFTFMAAYLAIVK
jgi:hypothetical protein